ncbi:MAG: hypothetical protein KDC38_06340 [Planctomycetes bacterium]|nr:hypothetical protein [Planctomycetota bacterium]
MTAGLFVALGGVVGVLQAVSLARQVGRRGVLLEPFLRGTFVGAALITAALNGGLLPAATGWLLGFTAGCGVLVRRVS